MCAWLPSRANPLFKEQESLLHSSMHTVLFSSQQDQGSASRQHRKYDESLTIICSPPGVRPRAQYISFFFAPQQDPRPVPMDVNADEEEMDEEAATQSFPYQVWRSYRKARRSRRRNGLAQNPNRRIMSFVQTGVLALFTIQSSQRDTWKSITTPKNSRRRLPRLFSNAACG
jgi:hypothetical protein